MVFANDNTPESPDEALYRRICQHAQDTQRCSVSDIQRTFQLGYNRASRMIERMEEDGLVGPAPG